MKSSLYAHAELRDVWIEESIQKEKTTLVKVTPSIYQMTRRNVKTVVENVKKCLNVSLFFSFFIFL